MEYIEERISLILPAYNESDVITESITRLIDEINKFSVNYEIIIVNDGSSDDTKNKIINLKRNYPKIKLISYTNNKGKGYAIKRGLLSANGDIDIIMDADLDIHPRQICGYVTKFLAAQKKDKNIAGVIGSKLDKRSNISFPLKRRIMSMGYYLILKAMFKLDTKDTNTGLKVYDGNIIKSIAPKLFTRGYAYDIELLNYIYSQGYRVLSLPIDCAYSRSEGSDRINIKHAKNTFKETIKIYIYNLKKRR